MNQKTSRHSTGRFFGKNVLITLSIIFTSCLNPISFNPESIPTINVDVSGSEIGIDNINSAEIRFVNHTKTMDIINVEMLIDGEAKTGFYYSYGDSRISGGPQAGTSEGILQRPTGENATKSITVNGYKVVIEYKKNTKFDQFVADTAINTLNWDGLPGTKIGIIGEYNRSDGTSWTTPVNNAKLSPNLLRGKQLLHFYRDFNGELQLSTSDPDADEHDNYDFIESSYIVNNTTNLNLDGIELSIASLPAINVAIPGLENFSDDIITQIADLHITLESLDDSLESINSSIITLADYLDQGNLLLLRLTEGLENSTVIKEKYGSLSVFNGLSTKIDSVYFIKQGEHTKYFEIENITSQSIKGPSLNNKFDNIFVLAGNYNIGIVAEGYEVFIKEYKIESFIADTSTRLNVYAGPMPEQASPENKYLIPNTSNIITYTLDADGGPPSQIYSEEYTTTEILVSFSKPVYSFTFSGISGTPEADETDKSIWRIKIAPTATETIQLVINGTDIDFSPHLITVYKQNEIITTFIPVTDVQILNNEKFDKDIAKTLQWAVIPSNATNQTTYWTFGSLDGNLQLAQLLGQTPPYELLGGTEKHTNYTGNFIVRNSWNYDYWYVAAVVENGKAPGIRNPQPKTVGETIDSNGQSYSITIQALIYDSEKDFIKIFRLTSPDSALPPVPPTPQPAYFDLTINFIEPANDTLAGVAVRATTRDNIPFNGRTEIQWATSTNSLTYKSYFLKHINPTITEDFYFSPKITKGNSTTITLPVVNGGYDIFFIEGDGRVRGYSTSTAVAPTKDKNMLFYIPGSGNNITVTYSSEDNQAYRIY